MIISAKKDDLFVIIVTYNGMNWIKKCLESIYDYSVIVVDNFSSDNTVSFIERNFPEVQIIKQKRNIGFGAANNIGISQALRSGGRFFFLMNQDCYVEGNCIKDLLDASKRNPEYGILSPVHLDGKGLELDKNFYGYLRNGEGKYLIYDFLMQKKLKEIYKFPFLNAAGWLVTRDCFLNVGGFDPIFFHYGEDENYCHRVKYHNLEIGLVPSCFILHDRAHMKCTETKREPNIEKFKRWVKIKYGNINEDLESDYFRLVQNRKRNLIGSILKLQKGKSLRFLQEINALKNIYPEIEYSRRINQELGSHYLDLVRE